MRVLITGINGFAGSFLAEYALSQGAEVWGTVRWRSNRKNIEGITDKLHLVECDLRYFPRTLTLLKEAKPDLIFHLAARCHTSWEAPVEAFDTNVTSQINLFESVKLLDVNPMILVAGSSEEYGLVYEHELPIEETNPLRPLSPYAVSKVAQDLLGFQYHHNFGLGIVRTRAFNHTGPRRASAFAESSFAKQIAEIEKGIREPIIQVGNLDSSRDFLDVRDVVRAYWLALEKGVVGEVYNIASGKSWKIGDILNILLQLSGVSVKIIEDTTRLRPSDPPVLRGDSSKFRARTDWENKIPFERTLAELLDYWRQNV